LHAISQTNTSLRMMKSENHKRLNQLILGPIFAQIIHVILVYFPRRIRQLQRNIRDSFVFLRVFVVALLQQIFILNKNNKINKIVIQKLRLRIPGTGW
jgi:hypothetical protein